MSKSKKQTFSKVAAVKANARARVGTPAPPNAFSRIPNRRPPPSQNTRRPWPTCSPAQEKKHESLSNRRSRPQRLCPCRCIRAAWRARPFRSTRTTAPSPSPPPTASSSPPDTAAVHIGYIVYGPDSDWAYASGSRLSHAIVDALTGRRRPPPIPSKAKTRRSRPSPTTRTKS